MQMQRRTVWMSLAWACILALAVATGALVKALWELRQEIEQLATHLTLETGPESTLLYDADDHPVSALFEEHRIGVGLDQISPQLVNAVLVTEDKRFHHHGGIDVRRIVMAAIANQRAGAIVQGGSTITQQLVRSVLLTRERSYTRKFKEVLLARRLEERYTKQQILEAYLNRVYFGDGYYGIEAAALGYFGKSASALDALESAVLAGLIKGPSLYSPTKAPELAKRRRDVVLSLMRQQGLLGEPEYRRALALPVRAQLAKGDGTTAMNLQKTRHAGYFREAVARELLQRFGAEAVYTGGLRVYTTLDQRLQQSAEETMVARLERVTRRGGDAVQGALVAIDPTTGHVKALVGGRDFLESPFNRAIDAKRQPGSAFKPFVFAMALESGYATSTLIDRLDEPILTPQGPWLPGGEHESSSVRLREALVMSSNRAAAHLLKDVGITRTLDLVQRFGISSAMPHVPSLALGTGEMSLYELTSAYTVFANRGVWRRPTMIRRVLDRQGREIYRAPESERQVISEANAYLMTSMMADVVNRGTASSARAHGFKAPAAGKTGTSQSYADAWFVGYTPHLVTGVWFGHDTPHTIMKRGFASVIAVPAWAEFMAAAHTDREKQWFKMPGSLATVKLCRLSGGRATDRCHLPVLEPARFDAENPLRSVSATLREGGSFDELGHVTRLPEPCTLPHADATWQTTVGGAAISTIAASAGAPTSDDSALEVRPALPASLRPAGPPAVLTIGPGDTAPRPVSVVPAGYRPPPL